MGKLLLSIVTITPDPKEIMRESELVKCALKGDQEAYRELFDRHCSYVFRVAMTYVQYREDEAEEITQKAFIQAFNKLDSLGDPEKFKPWLISITRHTALNHLKKMKNLAEVPLDPAFLIDSLFYLSQNDEKSYVEIEREMARSIINLISDESLRQTVEMFYIEGASSIQIAERQGISQSGVTSRLNRFRARYRKLIISRILEL